MSARLRVRVAAVAAIAIMIAETVMSSMAQPPLPPAPWLDFDKLEHASLWAVLGACLAMAARRPGAVAALIAVAIAVGFGASDELHQHFVPGRDASILDLAADLAGATLGASLATWWYGRRRDGRHPS